MPHIGYLSEVRKHRGSAAPQDRCKRLRRIRSQLTWVSQVLRALFVFPPLPSLLRRSATEGGKKTHFSHRLYQTRQVLPQNSHHLGHFWCVCYRQYIQYPPLSSTLSIRLQESLSVLYDDLHPIPVVDIFLIYNIRNTMKCSSSACSGWLIIYSIGMIAEIIAALIYFTEIIQK